MLVLTRKFRDQIQIGDNITITILRVKGQSVRVGIEAPRDVRVVRSELPPKFHQESVSVQPVATARAEETPLATTADADTAECSSGALRHTRARRVSQRCTCEPSIATADCCNETSRTDSLRILIARRQRHRRAAAFCP